MHYELNEYPRLTDGKYSCREYKRWAHEEWDLILADLPAEAVSSDYESGFLQGFVDHVFAGGSVTPPAMPPRRYWRLPYRNENGQQAIRQWYSGFEHGARVAREKGYRDLAVIPTSLLPSESLAVNDWDRPAGQYTDPQRGPTPVDPPESSEEVPPPVPEIPTEIGHRSPGGLPLPVTDEPVPMPERAKPEAISAPTEKRAATHADLTGADSLPSERPAADEIANDDAPPRPPWQSDPDSDDPVADTHVRQVSAEIPLDPAANAQDTGRTDEGDVEFDPFLGSPIFGPSRARSARPFPEETAEGPWTFGSLHPDAASETTSQIDAPWTEMPAGLNSASAPPISVAPLTVIESIPDGSPLLLSVAPMTLSAKTMDERQIEPPIDPTSLAIESEDPESQTPSAQGLRDATDAPEFRATEDPAASHGTGWHAIERQNKTQWKPKP